MLQGHRACLNQRVKLLRLPVAGHAWIGGQSLWSRCPAWGI